MQTKYLLVALAAVAITGCASDAGNSPVVTEAALAAPMFTQEEKDQMTEEEKVAIYNTPEEERNQIICRRVQITGSHRKRTVCRTIVQIQQEQEEARRTMQDIQIGGAADPAGGAGL